MRVAVVGASGYTGLELVRIVLRHPHFELVAATSEQRAGHAGGRRLPVAARPAGSRLRGERPGRPGRPRRSRLHARCRTRPRRRRSGRCARPASRWWICRRTSACATRRPTPRGTASTRPRSCWDGRLRAARALPRRAARGAAGRGPGLLPDLGAAAAGAVPARGPGRDRRHRRRLEVRRLGRRPDGSTPSFLFAERDGQLRGLQGRLRAPPRARDGAGGRASRRGRACRSPSCRTCCRRRAASRRPSTLRPRGRLSAARRARGARRPPTRTSASCGCCPRARRRAWPPCGAATSATWPPSRTSATDALILLSAIDNLVKGASGQAVQCANLMSGFPEETGLLDASMVP